MDLRRRAGSQTRQALRRQQQRRFLAAARHRASRGRLLAGCITLIRHVTMIRQITLTRRTTLTGHVAMTSGLGRDFVRLARVPPRAVAMGRALAVRTVQQTPLGRRSPRADRHQQRPNRRHSKDQRRRQQ
jgi:hypothetical protein